jgi:hypothetical protein
LAFLSPKGPPSEFQEVEFFAFGLTCAKNQNFHLNFRLNGLCGGSSGEFFNSRAFFDGNCSSFIESL